MWPSMEMEKNNTGQSKGEEDGEAAVDGGASEEGESKENKKEGLSDLEAKVAASMTASKGEAKSKVGKEMFYLLFPLSLYSSLLVYLHVHFVHLLLFPPFLTFFISLPPSTDHPYLSLSTTHPSLSFTFSSPHPSPTYLTFSFSSLLPPQSFTYLFPSLSPSLHHLSLSPFS